jgi:nucleolar protein 15
VRRLRLSRNRRTGRSKHYAFLEFASQEVANIAAATMNNYLLFGHILKCKVIPNERVHPELWKGANRKFRVLNGNKLAAKKLERPKPREVWAKAIESEVKKRNRKAAKLKALGYDFEPPVLKGLEAPVEVETGGALVEA